MTTYLIATPSLSKFDAVSNDVEQQREVLKAAGHMVYLYAQYKDEYFRPKTLTRKKAFNIIKSPDVHVIYHHSIEWKDGESLFDEAKGPIIFRYHNVTPEEYLKDNPALQKEVIMARWQTRKFIDSGKVCHYVNASPFNSRELVEYGAPEDLQDNVAPFHKIGEFSQCVEVETLKQKLKNEPPKILFVGRVIRHKGQHNLVRLIDRYIDLYGPDVRLYMVGKISTEKYINEIAKFINEKRLGSIARIHSHASFDELYTYYKNCDVFVGLSEHEGFGVPILEAQYNGLPVIALNRAAIKDTAGPNQIIFDELDFDKFSAAINILTKHKEMRDFLIQAGRKNYEKYSFEKLSKQLLDIVSSV